MNSFKTWRDVICKQTITWIINSYYRMVFGIYLFIIILLLLLRFICGVYIVTYLISSIYYNI